MKISNQTNNQTNFCGHLGYEYIKGFGMKNGVSTETCFFRDFDTIDFATKYLKNTFKEVKEKSIIIGACSTGEDAYSIKMLMGNTPARITAFDLGRKTVQKAQKGYFGIFQPDGEYMFSHPEIKYTDALKDIFILQPDRNLEKKEQVLKNLFLDKFEKENKSDNLLDEIHSFIKRILKQDKKEQEQDIFKLKDTVEKCDFIQGDIRDINSFLPDKKVQLFSFKNAFYHLVTDNNYCTRQELPKSRIKQMLDNIFRDINKKLDMNGLFIMGEKEHEQTSNVNIITKSLLDNGYIPIRLKEQPYPNVWKKVKENN